MLPQKPNIIYFDKGGKEHTELVLQKVKEYIEKIGDDAVLAVSSTTGFTAYETLNIFSDCNTEVIICSQDMNKEYSMPTKVREELTSKCQIVEIPLKYLTKKIGIEGVTVLRNFSQGIKVCIELLLYLMELTIVQPGKTVVIVGGTLKGADTAISAKVISDKKYKVLHIITYPES